MRLHGFWILTKCFPVLAPMKTKGLPSIVGRVLSSCTAGDERRIGFFPVLEFGKQD